MLIKIRGGEKKPAEAVQSTEDPKTLDERGNLLRGATERKGRKRAHHVRTRIAI